MPTDLTDDELLGIPLANLRPGELRRAFLAEAADNIKKEDIVNVQRTFTALQGRQSEEQRDREQEEHRLFVAREEHLLAAIREREIEIDREAEALDARTIRLADGRRAYVDGDKYRDEDGKELHDAARAEAEQLHLEQPNAATWQDKELIDKNRIALKDLRSKVEKLDGNGAAPDRSAALSRLEREFKTNVATAAAPAALPDYGDGDYMAAFGLRNDFKQASAIPGGAKPDIAYKPSLAGAAPMAATPQ